MFKTVVVVLVFLLLQASAALSHNLGLISIKGIEQSASVNKIISHASGWHEN
nr:hypothetical protein [candidate division Zixibacteria bacterium]